MTAMLTSDKAFTPAKLFVTRSTINPTLPAPWVAELGWGTSIGALAVVI
ncbi:hypothetical protein [Ornithinimicrobium sp. W1665]